LSAIEVIKREKKKNKNLQAEIGKKVLSLCNLPKDVEADTKVTSKPL
jgi:hypothetical protein